MAPPLIVSFFVVLLLAFTVVDCVADEERCRAQDAGQLLILVAIFLVAVRQAVINFSKYAHLIDQEKLRYDVFVSFNNDGGASAVASELTTALNDEWYIPTHFHAPTARRIASVGTAAEENTMLSARLVLVLVTKGYIARLQEARSGDPIHGEFGMALDRKGPGQVVVAILDASVRDTSRWPEVARRAATVNPPVDVSNAATPEARTLAVVKVIVQRMQLARRLAQDQRALWASGPVP